MTLATSFLITGLILTFAGDMISEKGRFRAFVLPLTVIGLIVGLLGIGMSLAVIFPGD